MLTAMADPLADYVPKSWSTYRITPDEGHDLPTEKVEGLVECGAESEMAKSLAELDTYDPEKMFFFDFEQMAAGHTAYGYSMVLRLTDDYRGHLAGKLAFVTYEYMADDPPMFCLYLEN